MQITWYGHSAFRLDFGKSDHLATLIEDAAGKPISVVAE